MGGGQFTGGRLAQGMNTTIRAAGTGHGERATVDFLESLFEGELNGGRRILPLPAVEIFPAVSDEETVRNHRGLRFQSSQVLSK